VQRRPAQLCGAGQARGGQAALRREGLHGHLAHVGDARGQHGQHCRVRFDDDPVGWHLGQRLQLADGQ
jgi:hypothetical protein